MAAHVRLRLLRLNTWPDGMRARVLWNGQLDAENGDGKPADNPADPVDTDNPLTPEPVEIWPVGKAGDGYERDGAGIDGFPQNAWPGYGDGEGIDGEGEDGVYNDYLTWTTAIVLPTLRDGIYKFAVRFEDALGTVQTDSLIEATITLGGVPRPPIELASDGYSGGNLDLSWIHSPDLEDLA